MTRSVNLSNPIDQIALRAFRETAAVALNNPVQLWSQEAPNEERGATIGFARATMGFMAALDWFQGPDIESVPGTVSGAWTFRNSRTPV